MNWNGQRETLDHLLRLRLFANGDGYQSLGLRPNDRNLRNAYQIHAIAVGDE